MKNKIKAMLTLVMGYFIYECALSIRVDKYPIPSILKGYIGTLVINLLAVFFLVYVYNTYVLKQTFKDIYVCKLLPVKKWVIVAFVLSISVFLCCICFIDGTWVKEELTKEQMISAIAYTIFFPATWIYFILLSVIRQISAISILIYGLIRQSRKLVGSEEFQVLVT